MAISNAKKAILRAKIGDELYQLLVKTSAEMVYLDDETTLAETLAKLITQQDMDAAIGNLRTELMGEGVPEAYDTFKELADYIEEHKEAAEALQSAIGNKADKSTVEAMQEVLDGLGSLAVKSVVEEDDLSEALKQKVNAAAEGNHSHENMEVLSGITAEDVAAWNGKGRAFYSAAEPEGLKETDLWVQLVD